MRLKIRLLPLLLLALLLASCTDPDLTTVAKALNDTAQGLSVFQATVIQANAEKLVSEPMTRTLLESALRVDNAGQRAVAITRGLNALAPQDRTNILAILNPVIGALADTQASITLGIADTGTQNSIRAALLLIQTSLNTAQLVLAAR